MAAAAQPELQVEPAQPKEGRVVIQPGNNLWRISRVLYGSGEKYTMLYKANKDQIRNPDLIYPGQIFKTPEVAAKVGDGRSQAPRPAQARRELRQVPLSIPRAYAYMRPS